MNRTTLISCMLSAAMFVMPHFLLGATAEGHINAIRRLERDFAANGGNNRLDGWRRALADYRKVNGPSLDEALLKARFHYYGERNAFAAVNALRPYIHKSSLHPEIPYFIWSMCGDIASLAELHGGGIALQPLINELGNTDRNLITNVRSYWASFIPADFKADGNDVSDIARCKDACTSEEGLKAWCEFLGLLEKVEIGRLLKEEQMAAAKRMKEFQRQDALKREAERRKFEDNGLKQLDEFLTLPNNDDKAMRIMLGVSMAVNDKSAFDKVPNYDRLVEKVGRNEADVVDLYFHLYVTENHRHCLEKANAMESHDERVLLIRYLCQTYLKYSDEERLKSLEAVLKVNPDNKIAKRNYIYLKSKTKN